MTKMLRLYVCVLSVGLCACEISMRLYDCEIGENQGIIGGNMDLSLRPCDGGLEMRNMKTRCNQKGLNMTE